MSMMDDPQFVFTAGAAVVGAVVWLIRLEGKVKNHDELDLYKHETSDVRMQKLEIEQAELRRRHDEMNKEIMERLSVIQKELSRIVGRLSISERSS